ncbi:SDR family NAD(P)-dependent oxidoreductase [Cohnella mopanensis]|uniref:SDR family NAD(P)-dependent oxidoreductase n=1 Tax=Cohnella mopanensis TaxID=2911966 RepID=UPI001EF86E5E|nr:SDR family NAD(P)-dependent oxidoreductase [Cohnella mopanensis]
MDKVACVTGTDYGLGLALTAGLLNKGYKVFAGRYNTEDTVGLAELKGRYADKLMTVHMDVSQDKSVRAAAAWIGERTGKIDLLINNAARLGDIESTIYDELQFQEMLDVYNVNAIGSLRVTQAHLELVLRSEGKTILNISSEAGSIGQCYRTNWFAYSMSKAALNMQTALLRNQLQPQGVHLLSVHPGWVQTHMQGKLDADATYTPEQAAAHILALADDPELIGRDTQAYVDLLGNPLPW